LQRYLLIHLGDVDTNSIDRENVNPKKKRKLEVADENIGESPNKIATSGKTTKRPVSIKFPRPNSNKELPSQQKVVQNASVSSSMDVDNVFEPEISKNTPLDELIKIAEKDFQFKRHLPVSLTESCFEHYAKNNSLVFYKKNNMVGVNDDEKVAGDRIYYRCVNWELTRCQVSFLFTNIINLFVTINIPQSIIKRDF
jgi:hypothetical protein